MRVVVALGGRALRPAGDGAGPVRRADVRAAARALAPLTLEHELVVCHASAGVPPPAVPAGPTDDGTAAIQGVLGYWLAQELLDAGVLGPVAAVVTRTVVPEDTDGGPDRVVEAHAVRELADRGTLVVCGGGVAVRSDGPRLTAADTPVDADATAALLALELDADRLLLLTDVEGVRRPHGPSAGSVLRCTTVAELRTMRFAPASMAPKVAAALRFVTGTGRPALIGAAGAADALLTGRAGTSIHLEPPDAAWTWPG